MDRQLDHAEGLKTRRSAPKDVGVPRMLHSAISAFTRVFDAPISAFTRVFDAPISAFTRVFDALWLAV
jgi:hypothetical protein